LDKKLPDSQKEFNGEARHLKKDYPSFFDEDSENTTKEGLEQLKEYIEGEANLAKSKYNNLTTSSLRDSASVEKLFLIIFLFFKIGREGHENKKFKQDSSEVVNDGSEPTPLADLDGGE
jgi:hypothetical protein